MSSHKVGIWCDDKGIPVDYEEGDYWTTTTLRVPVTTFDLRVSDAARARLICAECGASADALIYSPGKIDEEWYNNQNSWGRRAMLSVAVILPLAVLCGFAISETTPPEYKVLPVEILTVLCMVLFFGSIMLLFGGRRCITDAREARNSWSMELREEKSKWHGIGKFSSCHTVRIDDQVVVVSLWK